MLNGADFKDGMDLGLLELLVCPITKGPMEYNQLSQELISHTAGLAFPIRNDVPILLLQEARRLKND